MSERTVDEQLETLVGAARESYLKWWLRWIRDKLDEYGVEDVAEVFGVTELTPETVERILQEYCSGLVKSECCEELEREIARHGRVTITEADMQAMIDYMESIAEKPEVQYALPPDIQAEIAEIRAKPWMDGEKVYTIVYNFLIEEGAEPEEAAEVAREIAKTIPKIPIERRAEALEEAMGIVLARKKARQRRLEEFGFKPIKREKPKPFKPLELWLVKPEKLSLDELQRKYGVTPIKIQTTSSIEEAFKKIRDYYVNQDWEVELGRIKAAYGSYLYYLNPNIKCTVEDNKITSCTDHAVGLQVDSFERKAILWVY